MHADRHRSKARNHAALRNAIDYSGGSEGAGRVFPSLLFSAHLINCAHLINLMADFPAIDQKPKIAQTFNAITHNCAPTFARFFFRGGVGSTSTRGPHVKVGNADRIPRETLEERLEKTPSNARCFAQEFSLMC